VSDYDIKQFIKMQHVKVCSIVDNLSFNVFTGKSYILGLF